MKDRMLLLVAAIVGALAAALYFRAAGPQALELLGLVFMVALVADNLRLRRELKRRTGSPPSDASR